MKYLKFIPFGLTVALLLLAATVRPIHIFMAGDSTMALKPMTKTVLDSATGIKSQEPFPERGWGQQLQDFFADKVEVADFAQNGRSSRTFKEQGWWTFIVTCLHQDDYVVIQFGHNDAAEDKPDRYTSPEDYVKNLEKFVEETREKGATPILCTPVVRRRFNKGAFQDSHGAYVDLVKQVAKNKNVLFVDMYQKTKDWLIQEGDEKSKQYFLHIPAGVNRNFPTGRIDNTHFNEVGATKVASLFVEGLRELNEPNLAKQLK